MNTKFETTEEEDEKAYEAIAEALIKAYKAGRARDPEAKPYPGDLWEALLKIIGVGEWEE